VPNYNEPLNRARTQIASQASNDYIDLLYESISGRGRPAVRTARSLYEHLVNYRTVDAEPIEARRYVDYEAIGDLLDLELNAPREEDFTGKARKQVRHLRNKIRNAAKPQADAALKRYGSGFRRQWASKSLRDRAVAYDVGDDYDFYRLSSALMHGTATGILGLNTEIEKQHVFRTGPALSLAPLALRYGNRFFGLLLTDIETTFGRSIVSDLVAIAVKVDSVIDEHRLGLLAMDADLWPKEPPTTQAFLKVHVTGRWEWLLLDVDRMMTISSEPHNASREDVQWVETIVEQIEEANPYRTKSIIIGVARIALHPRKGNSWQPANYTLRQQDLTFDDIPLYRAVPVVRPGYDPSLHE
jgi:hypothetical protein